MTTHSFMLIFVFFLAATLFARIGLSIRQIRHVQAHRDRVPEQFAADVSLVSHQKAADYTIVKRRFAILLMLFDTFVLLCFTLFGGLQFLSTVLLGLTEAPFFYQMSLLVTFALISGLLSLPFDYYAQFVIEERFGFNRMSRRLFFVDILKGLLLSAVIGLPLAGLVLVLMAKAGSLWWVYAWLAWNVFQVLMLVLFPTVIAPLFNRFTPLEDEVLRERIEGLLARTGFVSKGVFVMDGSRRSSHGNAYFTGFGSAKRIVFYDTLISRLSISEIEAVLAHELGHFKLRHIIKRMAVMGVVSVVFLFLLGYLKQQDWFYLGLGVIPSADLPNDAMALLLFVLVMPLFTFFLKPLVSLSSRRHEFEADAFAAEHACARDLAASLVRLYEDNASTLTPDPMFSAFHDSHPPAAIRVGRLTEMIDRKTE